MLQQIYNIVSLSLASYMYNYSSVYMYTDFNKLFFVYRIFSDKNFSSMGSFTGNYPIILRVR